MLSHLTLPQLVLIMLKKFKKPIFVEARCPYSSQLRVKPVPQVRHVVAAPAFALALALLLLADGGGRVLGAPQRSLILE